MNPSCRRCRWIRPLRDALLTASLAVGADFPAFAETPVGSTAVSDIDGEELYLEVILNQARNGQLSRFVRRGERFFASADTLRQLGFRVEGADPGAMRALDEFGGVAVRYDAGKQILSIDAPLSQLSLPTTMLNAPRADEPQAAGPAPGALLNYDLYGSRQDGANNLTATAELRLFGIGDGVFSNTAVTRAYRGRGGDWRGETVRLDSSWQLSFPESAVTVVVGDTFSGFLNWTRTVRLGGVQIGRNFALQPYRITAPLPSFLGEVAVPSSVELYVNGMRQYSGQVPTGPFQLATVPGVTGAGDARIVVTDAFGRTRTLDFPFYATQQLLAKGLSDWSATAGVVRENYGLRSFSYANDPVASGNWRYGVSDRFTAEAHAETGGGLTNAGAGGLWLLRRAGVLSGSYAHSELDGRNGAQTSLAYSWNNGRFNFSADSQRTHGEYRDIASLYGPLPPRVSERVLAGFATPSFGNFSASYVRLAYPEGGTSRYAGAYWSQTFSRGWSAHLSLNQNLDDDDDRSVYLGVSVALGSDYQANLSLQRNGDRDDAVLDASRPVPGDGGYGWRVQARGGDDGGGGLAEAGWINGTGRYGLGFAGFGGASYGYASASGGLVLMGGHLFASRNIGDAFAVVSTDGVGGVPVKLENRLIGRTDEDGMLLVTPLNAWQHNKLSIDPMDLPANMRIADVDLLATPRDRSGARVRFAITPARAAVVVLHDAAGQPLPLGSTARIEGASDTEAIVGYDGETYFDALQAHNRLHARSPAGPCTASFDYPAASDAIPRIGPLICKRETAP
ncbi:fimbrial biogenesis outer membrane usher protein [Luteimonas gilva]|uniref:Fimbrial biogenesis outer membrane usher protein n=1 Tax=Luteimonas gilva TaxID=2572684 RepID=A0A4U5JVU8_9GAMM|nr:fimbria/pilus outer membrane usher protein [Luteimonas gilva]TKR32838.1 fimbrial biogenesis outer membrane usher protein [Luteimonas gilva]